MAVSLDFHLVFRNRCRASCRSCVCGECRGILLVVMLTIVTMKRFSHMRSYRKQELPGIISHAFIASNSRNYKSIIPCTFHGLDSLVYSESGLSSEIMNSCGPSGRELSETPTDFDRSNTGLVGSNPARGMDLCLRFSVLCCPV